MHKSAYAVFHIMQTRKDFPLCTPASSTSFDECAEKYCTIDVEIFFVFAVRAIIHMSWKFEHFINNNVHILFLCVDMMKSFSASRVVSMKIFSFKKSSTISRTWNTIFYSNLNALYNVNWSTISEWLEEIKVDVNDLI